MALELYRKAIADGFMTPRDGIMAATNAGHLDAATQLFLDSDMVYYDTTASLLIAIGSDEKLGRSTASTMLDLIIDDVSLRDLSKIIVAVFTHAEARGSLIMMILRICTEHRMMDYEEWRKMMIDVCKQVDDDVLNFGLDIDGLIWLYEFSQDLVADPATRAKFTVAARSGTAADEPPAKRTRI
jgi:hypothetical protein